MAKANPLRRWVREALSVSFWLHALTDSHIVPASFHHLSPDITRTIYNVLLFSFILYYSWLTKRGWFSVCFDLIYIYVWPFTLLCKSVWKATRWFYRFFKANTTATPMGLIILPSPTVTATNTPAEAPTSSVKDAIQKYKASKQEDHPFRTIVLRPFNKFALLWALLALSLKDPYCIAIALAITLYGAAKAVYLLWDFLSDTSAWIEKLRGSFAARVADQMKQVREWQEISDAEKISKDINGLKFLESLFSFISVNKAFLARCTAAVAIAVTIPFYVYVSFLFASVYVGTAHFAHLQLHFAEALIDSLYIPFAFTDLPHNAIIRSVAGLQAVAITLMGWNVFFRHLGGKFERMATAAEELRLQFNDEIYRTKAAEVASIIEAKKKAPASVRPNRTTRRANMNKSRSSPVA